jgi:hypothetical protein
MGKPAWPELKQLTETFSTANSMCLAAWASELRLLALAPMSIYALP